MRGLAGDPNASLFLLFLISDTIHHHLMAPVIAVALASG